MALKLLSRDFYKTADFQRTRGIEIKIQGRICDIIFRISFNKRLKALQINEPQKIKGYIDYIDCTNIKKEFLYSYSDEGEKKIKNQKKNIEKVFDEYVFYIYKNDLYFFDEKDIPSVPKLGWTVLDIKLCQAENREVQIGKDKTKRSINQDCSNTEHRSKPAKKKIPQSELQVEDIGRVK